MTNQFSYATRYTYLYSLGLANQNHRHEYLYYSRVFLFLLQYSCQIQLHTNYCRCYSRFPLDSIILLCNQLRRTTAALKKVVTGSTLCVKPFLLHQLSLFNLSSDNLSLRLSLKPHDYIPNEISGALCAVIL